jgi:hypothetical protein
MSGIANLVVAKSSLPELIDSLLGLRAIVKDPNHYLLRCRHA